MEVSGQIHIQLLLLASKGFLVLISWVGLRANLDAVENRKAFYFWLIDNSVISYVEENVSSKEFTVLTSSYTLRSINL